MRGSILVLLLLLFPFCSDATTFHVPSEYPTIQAGIDACAAGDTVLVASGTYTGVGNRDLSFGGTNLVLMSELGRDETVIDCEYDDRALNFICGESTGSVVSGFTIRRGSANEGGGIYCDGGSPTLNDLIIEDCYGGGNYGGSGAGCCLRNSDAVIVNSVFRGNTVGNTYSGWTGFGGGLASSDSSPVIRDVSFIDNLAIAGDAGGECCPTAKGGGACFVGGNPIIESVLFAGNRAQAPLGYNYGGGLYHDGSIQLLSCSFVDNRCSQGSAVYAGDSLILENSIIAFNVSGCFGGYCPPVSGDTEAICSIVFGNPAGNWIGPLAGQESINGNMAVDPLLCDWANGVLTVSSDSPCLPGNNACGEWIGGGREGCMGLAVAAFTASWDRSDGILLQWQWNAADPAGFEILRDGVSIHTETNPALRTWLDLDCELGKHDYALRARHDGDVGPFVYTQGKRLSAEIEVLSPNGGEVLHFGDLVEIRWLPDSGSSEEFVTIELSRNGSSGPWETLAAETPHDGNEMWLVSGSYSRNCLLRIFNDAYTDASDAPFKVGTHTISVPADEETIGVALTLCARHDTVLISPGIYNEHGMVMNSGSVLLGAGADATEVVIDGLGEGRILTCENTSSETRIERISFRNGHSSSRAGALSISRSSVEIRNCIFQANYADLDGGAIGAFTYGYGAPKIADCRFLNNHAGDLGGAVAIQYVDGTITNCQFEGNSSMDGGAVYLRTTGLRILDSRFMNNYAQQHGGAMFFYTVYNVFEDHIMSGCLLVDNRAEGDGGALYSSVGVVELQNFTFANNQCDGFGSAIYADISHLKLRNSLITSDSCNSIIGCSENDNVIADGCVNIYAPVGDCWAACPEGEEGVNGNISLDPLYCDSEAGDYRLDAASPCLPDNNDCGVLIGALGEGCDDTPVLLSLFTAIPGKDGIEIHWEATGAIPVLEFRLTAEQDGVTRILTWREDAPRQFSAVDQDAVSSPAGSVRYRLEGRELGESWQLLGSLQVEVPAPIRITRLMDPFPNPFNPSVTIPLELSVPEHVRLTVYDLGGRRVCKLVDGPMAAGRGDILWDGLDSNGQPQATGVYLVRMESTNATMTKRLVLLR
ncbi:MAG: T9SS type A sorting domain-containing protein [bacterium]|nr:T9SS type A sorting domain-containing protein [bacterium]